MSYREKRVEKELMKGVRNLGGLCVKFAPITAGVPDRVVMLPGGRVFFVELKRPGGSTRADQLAWHEKMRKRGIEPVILASLEDVAEWLKEVMHNA